MMRKTTYKALTAQQRRALDLASEVLENAYNPYSHFFVGATLTAVNGKFISGVNVENAAYGSVICAERSALVSAYSKGIIKLKSIAVIGKGENFDTTEVTGPCGACRQMLFEASQVAGINLEVILSTTKKDNIIVTDIQELLPLAFGPLNLGIDIEKYRK